MAGRELCHGIRAKGEPLERVVLFAGAEFDSCEVVAFGGAVDPKGHGDRIFMVDMNVAAFGDGPEEAIEVFV